MKRILFSAVTGALLLVPAVSGAATVVTQPGSYTFTRVIEQNGHVSTQTQQLDQRSYDQLSKRLDAQPRAFLFLTTLAVLRCPSGAGPNAAAIAQNGDGNGAQIRQLGSGGSALTNQTGSSNRIYAYQLGNRQTLTAKQTGDHNITQVVQHCSR
ncbi:MAG TPA: hypothetical protein VHL34_15200 [Rhizomicrobium sp.]|nr:hypothetical protein [Rhizomicrobium sp.]